MSLRWRLTLVIGGVVAVMLVGASFLAYLSAESELNSQVDQFLITRSDETETGLASIADPAAALNLEEITSGTALGFRGGTFASLERADASIQLVLADGRVGRISPPSLPVTEEDQALATLSTGGVYELVDRVDENGNRYRVRVSSSRFGVLMVGRPLADVEQTLDGLRGWLLLISFMGTVAAAGVGWIVADRVLRPVARLAAATEQVAETRRFDADLRVESSDELGALARSFNTMLSVLRASREQQERLVRDANHELRTPLTSLRTNIDVMRRRGDALEPHERESIMEGMSGEVRELTELVTELVGVATSSAVQSPESFHEVDLMELCRGAADRTISRTGREVVVEGPVMACVHGDPAGLERAIGNLLGNAVKFSPAGGAITVVVGEDYVEVLDRGPGIPEEETSRIFDRFYRSDSTRTMSGSGLGLAIVADIAAAHGGSTYARNREGGGAVVGFSVNPEIADWASPVDEYLSEDELLPDDEFVEGYDVEGYGIEGYGIEGYGVELAREDRYPIE